MKRLLAFLLVLLFISAAFFNTVFAEETAHSWYVTRNKDHRPPAADPAFSQMDHEATYYVDTRSSADGAEKVAYLTFDAGYENGNVEKIVDILNEEGVRGAFFVLTHFIRRNAALCRKMQESGHLLCNQSDKHRDMSSMEKETFAKELAAVESACLEATGKPLSKYFRPPEGRYSEKTLSLARSLGYKTVFWSFAYADWDNEAQPPKDASLQKIKANLHPGIILLLHPTSQTNTELLRDLIRDMKAEGYRFASLDELE